MALYTQEQLEKANNIDLEDFLARRGAKLRRTGKESRFYYSDSGGEHDSVSISGNRWYDHKNQTGGYPIKFMQEFYGLGFRQAVWELLDGETACENKAATMYENHKPRENQASRPSFALPEKAGNMKRLFAYLLKTRFLSRDVVKAFVDAHLLYQERKYNNIVFVGTDKDGNPKSASAKSAVSSAKGFRMTVTGSDCNYGFCWRGGGEWLLVFESAVDMMSYATLYPKGWMGQNYISLDGLSPKAMLQFLEENEYVKEVYLCLDSDAAGIEACGKLKDLLLARGYTEEQVWQLSPACKDWNEVLKAKNGVDAQPAQTHPKKDAYSRTTKLLKWLNGEENAYCQWREKQVQKNGQGFYIQRMEKELSELRKAQISGEDVSRRMAAGAARIADLSLCMLNGMETKKSYRGTLLELEYSYKPYQDKLRVDARMRELQKGIGEVRNVPDSQSLFLCLKTLADMAIRFAVYLQTDFAVELERRNSFQREQETVPETKQEEPAPVEQKPEEPRMVC